MRTGLLGKIIFYIRYRVFNRKLLTASHYRGKEGSSEGPKEKEKGDGIKQLSGFFLTVLLLGILIKPIVVESHTLGFFELLRMEEGLSTLLGKRDVDLRTPADLNRSFRDDVLKHAEVIYLK